MILWVGEFNIVRTCCESWKPVLDEEVENVKRDEAEDALHALLRNVREQT